MDKKYSFVFLLIIILSACKKEDQPGELKSFQIFVFQEVNDATIIWEPVKDFQDSVVEFELYINDSLIADHLKTRDYKITNLTENSEYTGKILAFSENRKIGAQTFKFTTLQDQPPGEFNIYEIAIRNNSVNLKWTKSDDPENGKIVYAVNLNNQLKVSNITGLSCELKDLNPSTYYWGEIVATDPAGNAQKTTFIFTTIQTNKSTLIHRYFKYQGYKRDFAYYLPAMFDSAKSIPLVINLHGANGNAWNEIKKSYFNTIADRENFIFLMPQALLGSFNGETIYQWNAHYIFPWDDVSLVNFLIDYMYTNYNVDLSRVYICGMSNGGFMTFFAARGLQNRLAAIAPISGLISSNVFINYKLNRHIPLCYMHGTADNIVRIDGNPSADDIISFWIANNNCSPQAEITELPDLVQTDNSTVTLDQYHGYSSDSEIQFYKIIGGGHSIPGIEPGSNMDINAYEVIWTFFNRHSYPEHAVGSIVEME
jgi:polyhydroxybutyrate depolymerase